MAAHHSAFRQRQDAINVTVSLCLCYTLCFFLIGVWLRVKSSSYKWDDVVALVATIFSLGQFATQYIALANGQGRSDQYAWNIAQLDTLNAVSRAGVILFFLTLYCSKASAIALTYKFAPLRRHKVTVFVAFGLTLSLGLVSVLLLNASCGQTGSLYWHIARQSNKCQSQFLRWQITSALDIATEILILVVPVDMIWSLQMRTKAKLGVLGRFWLRLPILVLAVGRFLYIRDLLSASDVGIESSTVIILQEVEMAASLSATVIITIKPLAKDFNTGFGQGGETVAQYGVSKATSSGVIKSSGSRGRGSKLLGRWGLSSKGGSVGASALRSRSDKGRSLGDVVDLEDLRHKRDAKQSRETSESVKGLTDDVIMQTIDYKVEFEDANTELSEGERSSRGHDRV